MGFETGLFLDTFSGIAVGSGIACRQQADRFLAEFDFKLVSGFEVEQCCIGLADEQVAISLHRCDIAQLATTFTNRGST